MCAVDDTFKKKNGGKKKVEAYGEHGGPAEGLERGPAVLRRHGVGVEVQLGDHVDGAVDGRPPHLLPAVVRVAAAAATTARAGARNSEIGRALPVSGQAGVVVVVVARRRRRWWRRRRGGDFVAGEADLGDLGELQLARFGRAMTHGRGAQAVLCEKNKQAFGPIHRYFWQTNAPSFKETPGECSDG